MAKVSANISIDAEIKKQAQELFARLGMDLSTAVNMFLKKCAKVHGIPFIISTDEPNADIISAMNGVLTGSYDGLVTDLPVSAYQIKNSFTDLQIIEEIPTGEQYGIAVSKDNPGLTAAINEALAAMVDDGSMAKIQTTWFGSEL